jgi:asparagine synthase (glutamine-hydrolysing)
MCGIVGVVAGPDTNRERELLVERMAASIAHRGPDGDGLTTSGVCTLGFRRLAIIDVQAPSLPFPNEDRSIWTVCNGQIYNSPELRTNLESRGHHLRNGTDTEVLPHLYEEHGLDLVQHLNGMFAMAVWDARRSRLLLARDRAGEKPLFYWQGDDALVFASELRALLTHPRVPRTLSPVALRRYLLHDFFPAPLTPFSGVKKLPAGHLLVFENGTTQVCRYWDLSDHFESTQLCKMSRSQLAMNLDEQISRAVRRRSRSDVPFGIFLSGGIDSSTVLSHVAEQQGEGVPVFSLGHSDRSFDESRFACNTAQHFGADYHELVLTEADLEEGLRLVAQGFDEPLGDASIIPTHLLSRLAREHVKVVLSGEGADELFGGYPTYLGARVADAFQRLPSWLQSALAGAARRLVPHSMGNVGLDYLLERFLAAADSSRIERHHSWFGSIGPEGLPEVLSPQLREALAADDPFASAHARVAGRRFPDGLAELLYTDFTMYLQDGLLTKVDRAAMLTSLEVRAPFLDHQLAELAAGIPSRFKLNGLTTKAILRDAVRHRLPKEVLGRRKRGFNIPFSRWLLHSLGERLRERFAPDRVTARGLLSPEGVNRLLDEHMERRADNRKALFTLMIFDIWCDRIFGDCAHVSLGTS